MTYTPSKFPPAAAQVWQGSLSSGGANVGVGGLFLNVAETSDTYGIASASGTTITLVKAGTYVVTAMAHTTSQVFSDNIVWRLEVYGNSVNLTSRFTSDTTPVNGNNGGGNSRAWCYWIQAMSAGNTFQIRATQTSGAWSVIAADGFVEVVFLPVLATPQ